jgi:hypothetical protein
MKTDSDTIRLFLDQTRNCAMQMMANGSYILKELPSLRMPDALRKKLETLCNELIGTKHDLLHEIFEVDDLMAATPDSSSIRQRIERMNQWIHASNMQFKDAVEAVREVTRTGDADGLLSLLLTESGINILNAVPQMPTMGTDDDSDDQEEADDETDDWEKNDEDSYDPNCYAFHYEDSYPIDQLIDSIRSLMVRDDAELETAAKLKVFLFAMDRLPLVTPGVRMSLGLRLDQGGESDWIEIRIEDGEFTLGRGTWIDGDAETESVFEVTPDYRDGDAFVATQFAESFAECARDVCREVVIEDFSDTTFTGWDLAPDKKRWSALPCSF